MDEIIMKNKYNVVFNINKNNKIYTLNIFYHDNQIYVVINDKMIYTCNENYNVLKYIFICNNLLSFVENCYIYFYDIDEIINNNFTLSKIMKKIQILKNEIPKFCEINKKIEVKYELIEFEKCFFIDDKLIIILNSLEFGRLLLIQSTILLTTKKLELHNCKYYLSENCISILLVDNKKEKKEHLINLFSYDGNINYLCTIVTNDIIYNICCSDNNKYICYIYKSLFGTYIKIYNVESMIWTHYKIHNIINIDITYLSIHNINILSDYYVLFIYDMLTDSILYYYIFTNEKLISSHKIKFDDIILSFDINNFDIMLKTNKIINTKFDIYIDILDKIYNDTMINNLKKIKINLDDNIQIIHKLIYDIINTCDVINASVFINIIYNNKCDSDLDKIIIDDCKKLLVNTEWRLIVEIIILKLFLIKKDFIFISNFTSELKYFNNVIKHFS